MPMTPGTFCRRSCGTKNGACFRARSWMRCFFGLHGVTDRDDVSYIYSTFPIVEREETVAYTPTGLARMNALAARRPDAEIVL